MCIKLFLDPIEKGLAPGGFILRPIERGYMAGCAEVPDILDGGRRTAGFASGCAVPRRTEVRMTEIRGQPYSSGRSRRRNILAKKQEVAPSRTRKLDRGTSD